MSGSKGKAGIQGIQNWFIPEIGIQPGIIHLWFKPATDVTLYNIIDTM